jgi:hypothetical protein
LAVFTAIMVGGVVSHRIMFRRRQFIRAHSESVRQRQLKQRQPKMWDVWAADSQSLEQWKDMNPLSVQVDSPHNSGIGANEPAPQFQPMNRRLALNLAHDMLLRPLPLALAPLDVAEANTPPSPAPVIAPEMQVAVLVAMPSPQHRYQGPLDLETSKRNETSAELGEYLIGTTRTNVHHDRDIQIATSS